LIDEQTRSEANDAGTPLAPGVLIRGLALLSCSVVALAIAASAPNVGTLAIATYFASAFSVLPKILIPLGAAAAPPDKRGRVTRCNRATDACLQVPQLQANEGHELRCFHPIVERAQQ